MYTDNSLEFGKACEDLQWNHCTSTLYRRETTGTAERAVRRVKERTSSILLQSGLGEQWWAESMECCCFLRNVQDLLSDEKTSHARRFEEQLSEPIIPFGAKVGYHPISAKGQARLHQFDKKVLSGKFMGYAPYAGGSWKGDLLDVNNTPSTTAHFQPLRAPAHAARISLLGSRLSFRRKAKASKVSLCA